MNRLCSHVWRGGWSARPLAIACIAGALVSAGFLPQPLAAQTIISAQRERDSTACDDRDEAMTAARIERAWNRHWRTYARHFAAIDGDFVSLPSYDPRMASSRGMTVEQVMRERTVRIYESMGPNIVQPRDIRPPRADAEAAANNLPTIAVGEYGHVHSFQVDKVIGPDEVIASNFWLVDQEEVQREKEREARRLTSMSNDARAVQEELTRRYQEREAQILLQQRPAFRATVRIKGLSTHGMLEQARYIPRRASQAVQIAIVGVERENAGNPDSPRRFVAVPVSAFRLGIDEQQFRQMLAQRGMTPQDFVELVLAEHRRDHREARDSVFFALQRARPLIGEDPAEALPVANVGEPPLN